VDPTPAAIDWQRFAAAHRDLLDLDLMEHAWR